MDIISLPIQGEFINTHSRYRLVGMVIQRARHLMEGDKPTLSTKYAKPTTIALSEVLSGNLEILHGKEALKYQQEARRLREERRSRFLSPEREEELRKEIKKDLSLYLSDVPEKGPLLEEESTAKEAV
jgi:DNA-directed RNA polymerase subunit omega